MNVEVATDNVKLFEALASVTRIKMIQLLRHESLNIKEISHKLGISSAIVTKHVYQLEEAGILSTDFIAGKRGMQKQCTLKLDAVTLIFKPDNEDTQTAGIDHYEVSIPIGQYSAYQVKSTCGLASETKLIGMRDDPRYFAEPEHVKAQHLWFGSGYVEYRIPNYLTPRKPAKSIRISLEICSEAPGYSEIWPSDISFALNDTVIGTWTSPGDFGRTKGKLTPEWWDAGQTQYGLLKTLHVDADGTYLDGVKLSDIALPDLDLMPSEEIRFRILCREEAEHAGGVSLFGRRFGNYEQDIEVRIAY